MQCAGLVGELGELAGEFEELVDGAVGTVGEGVVGGTVGEVVGGVVGGVEKDEAVVGGPEGGQVDGSWL